MTYSNLSTEHTIETIMAAYDSKEITVMEAMDMLEEYTSNREREARIAELEVLEENTSYMGILQNPSVNSYAKTRISELSINKEKKT